MTPAPRILAVKGNSPHGAPRCSGGVIVPEPHKEQALSWLLTNRKWGLEDCYTIVFAYEPSILDLSTKLHLPCRAAMDIRPSPGRAVASQLLLPGASPLCFSHQLERACPAVPVCSQQETLSEPPNPRSFTGDQARVWRQDHSAHAWLLWTRTPGWGCVPTVCLC